MEKQADLLKADLHHLKYCILYEVLQKKPIFESYRNFCKTIGDDVMEYVDFEFWYYRFYNGDLDFDYDRNAGPRRKELLELSVDILDDIISHLDPIERASMRKMNKTLKNIADRHPPKYEKIEVSVNEKEVEWRLNEAIFECKKKREKCTLKKRGGKEVLIDENYLETDLQMFENIMRTPRLEVGTLSLTSFLNQEPFVNRIPDGLSVKSLDVYCRLSSQAQIILSRMQPGVLESIKLNTDTSTDGINNLIRMEQWKQAKKINLSCGHTADMDQLMTEFLQFPSFQVAVHMNIPGDIIRIRDALSTIPNFKDCELRGLHLMENNRDNVARAIGGIEIEGKDEESVIRHYPVPQTDEILEFIITKYSIGVKKKDIIV